METFVRLSYLNKGEDKICGIVGVFGIVSAQHEKAFKELLVVDQLRGEHSTGMAIVSRGNAYPSVVKAIGGPENIHPRAEPDASIWEVVGRREVVGKTVPGYKGGGLVKRQYFLIQPYAERH